jgi:hypothetical protein
MKERRRKYQDRSAVDVLLLRDKLGLSRYRKQKKRDEKERRILIDLGLKKIREREEKDFILIGRKKRRLKVSRLLPPE